MGKLFGTDGIRGISNSELTCELATSVGKAVVATLNQNGDKKLSIVIGMDTRRSSDMLCSALVAGICSMGANAVCVGEISTPGISYLVKKLSADAGIMISASHNPAEYNGIKVFSSDGIKLSDRSEDKIEALIPESASLPTPIGNGIGNVINHQYSGIEDYCKYLKSTVSPINFNGLSIAVDCSNGSASRTAVDIFSSLASLSVTLLVLFASKSSV